MSDGSEETRLAEMPSGRRQSSSRRAPEQRAQDEPHNVENSTATENDVREASLPSEPASLSGRVQSEDTAQDKVSGELEVGALSMATPPPRQNAPRLASLKSRRPPVLFADSTVSEPSKPKLKFLPKSALRRSKEVRDAVEKAEADRRQSRLAAEATSIATTGYRAGLQGRGGRGNGRGTGRSDGGRFAGGQASGHLSGSTIGDDGGRRQKVTRAGFRGAASEPSRSAARAKNDIIPKSEKEGSRNISGSGSTRTRAFIKEEASGSASALSDDEPDIAEGPRVNIEHINLISDDESGEEDSKVFNQHQGGLMGSDKKVHSLNLRPVRVDRHEHVERAIGGSMDLGSLTSAELRRRAQQRQDAEGSLFISDDVSEAGLARSANGKPKVKDVEFIRDERRWKGVYQDEEGDNEPRIKEEPREDDNRMAVDDVEPVTASVDRHSPVVGEGTVTHEVATDVDRSGVTETHDALTSMSQQSKRLKVKNTVFQTEEDREEWNRYQEELEFLREELGTTRLGLARDAATFTATDEGANPITNDSMNLPDRKEGHVYLFQIPPIAPQLLTLAQNENRLEAQAEQKTDATHASQPSKTSVSAKYRLELEERLSEGRTTSALDATATPTNPPRTPGKVGTLRVYDSGRVKIEWGNAGGASMELRRGFRSSMLQEVIMTNIEQPKVEAGDGRGDGGVGEDEEGITGTAMRMDEGSDKEKEKSSEQEKEKEKREQEKVQVGDTAWAVGELAGSFVMTPDWDRMFKR